MIGEALTVLGPGHGVVIPAGTPHHSLSEPAEVVCINLYAAPGSLGGGDLVSDLGRSWRKKRDLGWAELAD